MKDEKMKNNPTLKLWVIICFFSSFKNVYTVTTQTCPTCLYKKVLTIKEENTLWYKLKDVCPKEEKKFVIIIPSYNNKDWYKNNLDSVFMQVYNNYRVIYIDDASTDGTGKLVEDYIKEKGLENKITLIKNKRNQGAMANWYFAIHTCQDDEIIVNLDGDDWLTNDHVLTLLNKVYSDHHVWLTYGQFKLFPFNKIGHSKAASKERIINNNFRKREKKWFFSHLRTFYAWLFKKIKTKDLKLNDTFFPAICDLAMMIPMLEMAGFKSMFIPDILYIYNIKTPLNDYKLRPDLLYDLTQLILKKEKYKPLSE